MKADLNTFPESNSFELVMKDGSLVPGQFGTWALYRLGQKRKLGLKQLGELFQSEDLPLDVIVEYALCAIEHKCRQEKKPFAFTDVDLLGWADDTGSGIDALTVLFQVSFSNLPAEEKKTEPEALSGTN